MGLAKDYIVSRRSRASEGLANPPVVVSLGRSFDSSSPFSDGEPHCFERDWVMCPRQRAQQTQDSSSKEAGDTRETTSNPKRRKLKDGKALSLHNILDEL